MLPPDDTTKRCTKCGETKLVSEFGRHNATRDGHHCHCQTCVRAYRRAHYVANRAVTLATNATWKAQHTEQAHALTRAWREAHPDRHRAMQTKWAWKNRDTLNRKAQDVYRRRQAERPGFDLDRCFRRRARLYSAPVIEKIDRDAIWERDGGRCHVCGELAEPTDWHLDHVVALAKGGEHSAANVAVSHPWCNMIKNRHPVDAIDREFCRAETVRRLGPLP